MKPFIKDPDAVLDYEWDWARWLDSDTIVSHEVFPIGAGITVDSHTATLTSVTAFVSGGTVGVLYGLTCRVVTAGGRTDDRTINILIRGR
jgi:hypothetical protein